MLLASAWKRLLVAGAAVAALWLAVLYVAPNTPFIAPEQAAIRPVAVATSDEVAEVGPLRVLARSGQEAPGGGNFDRFVVPSQDAAAPINAAGQAAFYATVLHAPGREGIFLAGPGRVAKIAAYGDAAPGGGTLSGFSDHPLPALNAAGHVAFVAQVGGGRSTEGIFLAGDDGLRSVALAGDEAPGVPLGMLISFDQPALNDNDEIAFVASVRAGADTLDVLYFWNGRRLQKVIAERDLLLHVGGAMDAIGEPALNNSGVIAFPASILKGPVLGGIFIAGARPLSLVVRAGDRTPGGAMIQRVSERIAIDESDDITFGAFVGGNGSLRGAVLRASAARLAEIAVEGEPAPDGGHYAGFGPWPTAGPDGAVAFIAALDGAPGPLAVFAGPPGELRRVAMVGERLPQGGRVGRFPLNAIASIAAQGALTFLTVAAEQDERTAIYCRRPRPSR
jgi:hypothetical protein